MNTQNDINSAEHNLQSLKDAALKGGALEFGVADPAKFHAATAGYKPEDLLPSVRSVIVIGGAKPRSGDWASPKYQHLEVSSTSDRVTGMCMKLTHKIERELGYYALTVPAGVDEGQKPFLNIALAAELAGCGTQSLAGPVLSEEHGFLYYGVILTSLPLPFDEPLSKPVCPAPECISMYEEEGRTPCTKICPINDGGCLGGRIEDGEIKERQYDGNRCTARVYNYWIPSFQKILGEALDEPDIERRRMMMDSNMFTRSLWSMTYSNISQGQCFECIRVCPVDIRTRQLS